MAMLDQALEAIVNNFSGLIMEHLVQFEHHNWMTMHEQITHSAILHGWCAC
jgi:hypothetical protein